MAKFKYSAEFELKASPKVLYPYLSTASGLQQWFATKVTMRDSQTFKFTWDGQDHIARQTVNRLNKATRFDFESGDPDVAFIELKVDLNEFTQTTFLKVTDYSNNSDESDLIELWEGLIENLKEAASC
jgi:YD repeat-containing protein